MKIREILDLDCRVEENKQYLLKALKKIPPLAKYDEIPLEAIEKAIGTMTRKYTIMIQYICPSYINNNDSIYCVSLKLIDPYQWLENVYGCNLYEVMAKTALRMYAEVKKGTVKLMSESTVVRRREDEIKSVH